MEADCGSYFCNYIYRTQTNMGLESRNEMKKKDKRTNQKKEKKESKVYLEEKLIDIECEGI